VRCDSSVHWQLALNISKEHVFLSILRTIFKAIRRKKCIMQVKGKAIPLQAWTGPEGSRRLRLPDFKTIGT